MRRDSRNPHASSKHPDLDSLCHQAMVLRGSTSQGHFTNFLSLLFLTYRQQGGNSDASQLALSHTIIAPCQLPVRCRYINSDDLRKLNLFHTASLHSTGVKTTWRRRTIIGCSRQRSRLEIRRKTSGTSSGSGHALSANAIGSSSSRCSPISTGRNNKPPLKQGINSKSKASKNQLLLVYGIRIESENQRERGRRQRKRETKSK